MRKWRVGNFSMGIILIIVGVLMLLSLTKNIGNFAGIMKWWPLLLIVLGGEVLLYLATAKEEQTIVKYDVFSIFIIFLVLIFAGTGFALSQAGVLEKIVAKVQSEYITIEQPLEKITINDNIKKIVIQDSLRQAKLTAVPSKELMLSARAIVQVNSGDLPQGSLPQLDNLIEEKMTTGDTLYLKLKKLHNMNDITYDIFIPNTIKVELTGRNSEIELNTSNIKNDWKLFSAGSVKVVAAKADNVLINAWSTAETDFIGNIDWMIEDNNKDKKTYGKYTLGAGEYKINIYGNSEIELAVME